MLRSLAVCLALVVLAARPSPALATFHLMEIEQVIGGVGGDATAQAVQLKMRAIGQQLVSGNAQLVVRDAAGANPVVLSTFPLPNPQSGACREILLATTGFAARTTPAAVADFTMSAIPATYLPAGTLTFEGVLGSVVYWRVSWGGGAYTGSHAVSAGSPPIANDPDGNTAPAFATALPSAGVQALHFTPPCSTDSTNSAAQYALTVGAATFTNNALSSFAVNAPPPAVPALPPPSGLLLAAALGAAAAASLILRARRA